MLILLINILYIIGLGENIYRFQNNIVIVLYSNYTCILFRSGRGVRYMYLLRVKKKHGDSPIKTFPAAASIEAKTA